MNILIIEDELAAQNNLTRLIRKYYPDFNIIGKVDSISEAIKWLNKSHPDIIFMDVELSDGHCFEIFNSVEIDSFVIITTAYENYALNAFKAKCIDYLMKPIDDDKFTESVGRCIKLYDIQTNNLRKEETTKNPTKAYKQKITLKIGNQIVILDVNNISYFYSDKKSTYIVTSNTKKYLSDMSLDAIESEIDPAMFFKLSRGCLASSSSIRSITKYFNSRLKITLIPENIDPIIVPRSRVHNFLKWIKGNN